MVVIRRVPELRPTRSSLAKCGPSTNDFVSVANHSAANLNTDNLLPNSILPILVETPSPHRTEGFPWGHSTTRPGVIIGATVGSVLGAATIVLACLYYARRTAWCFVRDGPRAHTPVEHFENGERAARLASVIPHYHPPAENLEETKPGEYANANANASGSSNANANEETTGYPHTYLNVPPHLYESPSPPGTPETPETYATCLSEPWAIPCSNGINSSHALLSLPSTPRERSPAEFDTRRDTVA
ncbi:hypothetical protein CspeluHIS016_0303150 [Cutaneotrichosporon spelunceum]|uniref:Uncharacterized protein n=1 Tax=Cutaneotrichosporon spelunceum TaxID=1672016 RepID=A0AAD3TT97_9TREE|nr:hypothetical protein CspeluHIS016_0303150 [Cutaneotrichosporon spelunceum]